MSGLSEEETILFRVRFKPKASWVDKTYLGNMMVEALGYLARQTLAFDFEVEYIEQKPDKEK